MELVVIISAHAGDLMSRLKTFSLSLEVICAAVETLCQLGYSDDIKQTQVENLCVCSVPFETGDSCVSEFNLFKRSDSTITIVKHDFLLCHVVFFYSGFSEHTLW